MQIDSQSNRPWQGPQEDHRAKKRKAEALDGNDQATQMTKFRRIHILVPVQRHRGANIESTKMHGANQNDPEAEDANIVDTSWTYDARSLKQPKMSSGGLNPLSGQRELTGISSMPEKFSIYTSERSARSMALSGGEAKFKKLSTASMHTYPNEDLWSSVLHEPMDDGDTFVWSDLSLGGSILPQQMVPTRYEEPWSPLRAQGRTAEILADMCNV